LKSRGSWRGKEEEGEDSELVMTWKELMGGIQVRIPRKELEKLENRGKRHG